MLSDQVKCKLVESWISPAEALKASGQDGALMSLDASWHRAMEGKKEVVELASFAFLIVRDGKPIQVEVEYDKGKMRGRERDLSSEMGDMSQEEELVRKVKWATDAQMIEKLGKHKRIKNTMKKAKHLRVAAMSFVVFDDEYEAPVWRFTLKNWPLTTYFRREKPVTVEVVVEGSKGKVLDLRKVI